MAAGSTAVAAADSDERVRAADTDDRVKAADNDDRVKLVVGSGSWGGASPITMTALVTPSRHGRPMASMSPEYTDSGISHPPAALSVPTAVSKAALSVENGRSTRAAYPSRGCPGRRG